MILFAQFEYEFNLNLLRKNPECLCNKKWNLKNVPVDTEFVQIQKQKELWVKVEAENLLSDVHLSPNHIPDIFAVGNFSRANRIHNQLYALEFQRVPSVRVDV